jgi:hypothetical protein
MRGWDLDGFFALVTRLDVLPRTRDRDFFRAWIERCVSHRTGKGALNDPEARRALQAREDYIRPGKQRLRVKHQLDSWRQPPYRPGEIYQLSYRHPVGRTIASDISDGLQGGAA